MDSFKIRQKFLDFFKKHGHTVVESSSLIPAEDPTLLFANAGMNQFKDLFLGKEKRAYTRATSSQKCVRAGGKHNDLDEVGFTNRHLTFFEMLGNFSFGDYFKKEAIQFGWDFLTKEMGIAPERLVASVYKTDDESYELWNKMIGLPPEKIFRLGEADNFWQMGETGPCGPCSEIHVDYGKGVGCKSKSCDPSCSCGRYVEVWNLVFMQYDKQDDGTLKPLKQTGVDTGMGLERLCMIIQDKKSIFEIDLFTFLIKEIEKLTGVSYKKNDPALQASFHVLSDHIRSSVLLIADGCSPSNEGRGYVLRKIIRRAALFARKLTDDAHFFSKLAQLFIDTMSSVFKNVKKSESLIIKVLQSELERFSVSLEQGQQIFIKYVAQNKKEKKDVVSGEQVFTLYDTYGFPPELTRVMALENGFSVDMVGFEKEMEKQRAQSGKKDKTKYEDVPCIPDSIHTKFVGYDSLESKSTILFVEQADKAVWIVTEESPFYVESGGQIGDIGWVTINDHSYPVKKLYKSGVGDNPAIAVQIALDDSKKITVGDLAHCVVDSYKRVNAEKNHTATHLLQAALVHILGPQVKQAGSLVNDEYLRFDFTSHEAMNLEQIAQVEQIVNQKIEENIKVKTLYTTLKEAQNAGVTAFFGEKYNPEKVRVVQVDSFSAELCGGTHVAYTGEIGCFKITSESALATGVRRLVAITGPQAVRLFQQTFMTVKMLSELYKVKPEGIVQAVQKQQEQHAQALREIKQMKKQLLAIQVPAWQEQIEIVNEKPYLFLSLTGYDNDDLKTICQEMDKKTPGLYIILSHGDNKSLRFVGFVSKTFVDMINLRKLSGLLKDSCGLRGGGKPDLIQGGGNDVDIELVKKTIKDWLKTL